MDAGKLHHTQPHSGIFCFYHPVMNFLLRNRVLSAINRMQGTSDAGTFMVLEDGQRLVSYYHDTHAKNNHVNFATISLSSRLCCTKAW